MSRTLPAGQPSTIEFLDLKQSQTPNFYEGMDTLSSIQVQRRKAKLLQTATSLTIKTRHPVLVTFFSDLHLGDPETEYPLVKALFKTIQETDQVYGISIGDDVNQMGKLFRGGSREEIAPPAVQSTLAVAGLTMLDQAGKLLAIATGNHNLAEPDWYQAYTKNLQAPVIGPNMGTIDLCLDNDEKKQKYKLFIAHEMPGSNVANPTLRARNANLNFSPGADVIALGHTHRKFIHQSTTGLDAEHHQVTYLETGSAKPDDNFRREHAWLQAAQYGLPGVNVILFPGNEHRVMPFYELGEGIEALEGLILRRKMFTGVAGSLLKRNDLITPN
jgi:hypothetical protein